MPPVAAGAIRPFRGGRKHRRVVQMQTPGGAAGLPPGPGPLLGASGMGNADRSTATRGTVYVKACADEAGPAGHIAETAVLFGEVYGRVKTLAVVTHFKGK